MELPPYLYHYTSIETLALLLKSRSIRFSALNTVDDTTEGLTSDLGSIGQWFLVSCWSDDASESIPLWHMYSSQMKGVRIRLPAFPFADADYRRNGEYLFTDGLRTVEGPLDFYLAYPKEKLYPITYAANKPEIRLFIQYTKDSKNLWDFRPEDIGKFKETAWSFQHEWRYRVFLVPKELRTFDSQPFTSVQQVLDTLERLFSRTKGLLKYYDMELSNQALEQMNVLAGPRCGEAEFEIIEALKQRHGIGFVVEKSQLKLRK
jgi:hypothetical protein